MSPKQEDSWWPFFWSLLSIIGIIVVVAAVIFPMFARERIPARRATCQSNMKELGLAIQLYCGDYDDMMPSSALYGGSKTWNKNDFVHFAKERGNLSSSLNTKSSTWPMILYSHMISKDIIWCPSDPAKSDSPSSAVSYYWKAAVDRAWYGDDKFKARKINDFAFPGNQIIFYENRGRHYGGANKGLTDGNLINCVFIDGHVVPKRIIDSGYTSAENPPEPLPKSGVGEPAWFNYNFKSGSANTKGAHWNPQEWGDNLP